MSTQRGSTMMLKSFVTALAFCAAGAALAKLPPLSDEQKEKAAEAATKAADTAKKEAELLGKAQDRTAEKYAVRLKADGKEFKPTPIAAPAPAAPTAAAAKPAEAPKK